jgi:hypothetical protein
LLVELELELLDGCFSSVVALGVLLEPAPAEPLMLPELDGAVLDEDEDEPPLA